MSMQTNTPPLAGSGQRSRVTEVMVASVLIFIALLAAYVLVLQVFRAMGMRIDSAAAWVALVAAVALAAAAGHKHQQADRDRQGQQYHHLHL